jgi:hypothetical protein
MGDGHDLLEAFLAACGQRRAISLEQGLEDVPLP